MFTVFAVLGRFSRRGVGGSGNAGVLAGWLPGEPTVTVCESLLSHQGLTVTERKECDERIVATR